MEKVSNTIYTYDMIKNDEFEKNDYGSAIVDCNNTYIDTNTGNELETTKMDDKCLLYNITDKTTLAWPNQGTVNNPQYVIPCVNATFNLSKKYILDNTDNKNCIVKKSTLSLVDNDNYTFTINPIIKCTNNFTGFDRKNVNNNLIENVCIQTCKNNLPFTYTLDTNRPICKYRPIYNIENNVSCPDGKVYLGVDVKRLPIDLEDIDMPGVCIANTLSYVNT